jgi:hypothetical protein
MSTITPIPVDNVVPDPGAAIQPEPNATRVDVPAPFVAPPDEDATGVDAVKPDEPAKETPKPTEDPDEAFTALMDRTYGTGADKNQAKPPETPTPPAEQVKPTTPIDDASADSADQLPREDWAKLGHAGKAKYLAQRNAHRETVKAKAAAEAALQEERTALDTMIGRYGELGIKPEEILPAISEIEAVGKGHPPGAILQRLNFKPAQDTTKAGIPREEVESLISQLSNAINPELVVDAFKAKHFKEPIHTPAPAQPVAPVVPASPVPSLNKKEVLDYAGNLLDVVNAVEGKEFADRVKESVRAAFTAEQKRLNSLGFTFDTTTAKATFKQTFDRVLASERRPSAVPPTVVARPSSDAPPSIDPNDPDASFNKILLKRYGTTK